MNIAEILQSQAQDRPHTLAIIDSRRSQMLSFAALNLAAEQAAALLSQAGLQAGDAALILQPMSADLYIVLMALFRVGMTAMFLDPSAGPQHIERCCKLYPPQALIASSKAHLLKLRSPALRRIRVQFAIGFPIPGARRWQLNKTTAPTPIHPSNADSPALLTFTSGSTGQPKAALRTHGFLLAQHQVLASSLSLTPGQIDLTTLPIFVLANLASGVTSLLPDADLRRPGQIQADRVFAQIQKYQPQSTAASPAFLERLAQHCESHGQKLSSFEKIFSGGAPVFPGLLERLQQLAPQAEVTAVYGSTEAEPIAHIANHHLQPTDRIAMLEGKGLLVGRPVAEIQLRIWPDRWGEAIDPCSTPEFVAACLPAGKVGEIVVSGAHVLPGYLQGRGNEETKFQVDGLTWHRTGDAGYLDNQGRLWLMGRCSARIQDEQGTLYPFAVEVAASHDPQVQRTAFVLDRGQRTLVVEWVNPKTPVVALASLKRSLAWAKIQQYRVVRQLPVDKRHNAKIDYPALAHLLHTHPNSQS